MSDDQSKQYSHQKCFVKTVSQQPSESVVEIVNSLGNECESGFFLTQFYTR
jgi:hypothetical protein